MEEEYGSICGIYEYRPNPDNSSPYTHQYKVERQNREETVWESMEEVLEVAKDNPPMKTCCSTELITELHATIMKFIENTKNNKEKNELHFVPHFDLEEILDEKQDSDSNHGTIEYLIHWKGWPLQYNSWVKEEWLSKAAQPLIYKFRRYNNNKNLGNKGFSNAYWNTLKVFDGFIDGDDNATQHANYAYALLARQGIKNIQRIADFGFGKGNMFHAFVKQFKPKHAYGLEPSEFIFNKYRNKLAYTLKKNKIPFTKCHTHLECIDLIQFVKMDSMNAEQVEEFNSKHKQQRSRKQKNKKVNKKNKILMNKNIENSDNKNKLNDEEIEELFNNAYYTVFCHCSNKPKSIIYYKNKMEKYSKENNKNKMNENEIFDKIFERFQCDCCKYWDGSFNLGLCVSVCQYLSDNDVDIALNYLSKHCEFLYFDVVTSEEYNSMKNGSQFQDKWAIHRPKKWYRNIILKYWRMVSNCFLESKFLFPDSSDSNFPNSLYHIEIEENTNRKMDNKKRKKNNDFVKEQPSSKKRKV
eukprot:218963_1